jgi:hypothetical protein
MVRRSMVPLIAICLDFVYIYIYMYYIICIYIYIYMQNPNIIKLRKHRCIHAAAPKCAHLVRLEDSTMSSDGCMKQ